MKRISKLFAAVSAMIILVSTLFAFPVSAANVRFTASNVSGAKGETVTINVNASGDAKIWGTVLELKYNSSQLQYVSHSKGNLYSTGSIHNNGSSVKFAGNLVTDKVKGGGTVFSVKFKILMSSGSSTLSLSSSENIDDNFNSVSTSASNGSVKVTVPVSGISLNTNNLNLKKGGTAQLNATVSPDNATNKSVTFSSSNNKVATVNGNGKVTAVGGGTATITAKSGNKTATCKVSVTVPQTGIKASGNSSKTVGIGSSLRLKIDKIPGDATDNFPITWTSADTKIAAVSANGTVTGVALGETTVTAKSNGWTAQFKITVVEKMEESSTELISDESSTLPEESELITDPETSLTYPETESTTAPAEQEKGFFGKVLGKVKDILKRDDANDTPNPPQENSDSDKNDNTVSKVYHYAMLAVVAVVTAAISISVTYFVTAGYYKNKKKNDESNMR